MMLKVVLIACLLATILTNVSVSIKHQKYQDKCYTIGTGGGFSGKPVPISPDSNCQEKIKNWTFVCSQQCGTGCMIKSGNLDLQMTCSSSPRGLRIIDSLDLIYSLENNDKTWSLTYPWCQCGTSGTSRTTWVILFLVLIGIGAVTFYFLYWKKRKPKDIPRSQFSAAISNYQMP